ncbi:hypothetical protein Tco_0408776 [Tanacetum coccineum]
MGLWYPKDSGFELIAYSNANHAGCHNDCKSMSGGLQFLGEKLVSWSSKKQKCTAMSTSEAEYVSLSACCAQSAIAISCNLVQHSRTKHINIRYHFIKEHVERGTIELYFVGTEYQLADPLTKALPKERFKYLVHQIEFIMAQQPQQDIFRDQLCPPNKQFDLMDANKKIDLVNPQCPNESKILEDILNHHLLRFNLVASASVPWIYIQQLWHTLKLDDSKNKFKFFLDTKEFKFSVDDFRRVFQLPQATNNNNAVFFVAPNFSDMLPFFRNELGFSLPLRLPTHFVSKGLPQPWQTLVKIFARCLTTRST